MQCNGDHLEPTDRNVKPKEAKKIFDGATSISLSGTVSQRLVLKLNLNLYLKQLVLNIDPRS